MTLWLLFAFLTLVVLALVVYPLFGKRDHSPVTTADYDLQVYKRQLKEVSRDRERGAINEADAEAAEAEIGRRILAADQERRKAAGAAGSMGGKSWIAILQVALLLPAGSFWLYDELGQPGLPNLPYAERSDEIRAAQQRGSDASGMEEAIASLEKRLAEEPDYLDGWNLLGRSYLALGRYTEAVQAYERAVSLDSGNPEAHGAYGEALVLAADGLVTEEAAATFNHVVDLNPGDPRANFYLAQADYQIGKKDQALDRLLVMLSRVSGEEAWLSGVIEMANGVAGELGRDISGQLPEIKAPVADAAEAGRLPALGAEDMAAMADMSPEERQEVIQAMVDQLAARLEQEPGDIQGWAQLARAYQVMGRRQDALAAYDRLIEASGGSVGALVAKARMIREFNGNQPDDESAALMARVLEIDPDHLEATWFSGLAAVRDGDRDRARTLFDKVLATLDPQSSDYANMAAEVSRLLGKDGS